MPQPPQRNAETTKAKIIDNAMQLFSKKGFDATTVDDIAGASGVNKALLYYYFKNKSGLYEAVMTQVLDAIHDAVANASGGHDDPATELEAFVITYARYAQEHPYFPALLLRELSDSGAHLPEMMFGKMRRLFALLGDILKRGEVQGVFKPAIPMVVHFMIIGTLNMMVTTAPLRIKAAQNNAVDTCAECSMDEIAEYLYNNIKTMLEVNT
jgi:TetR/AcrR family transcriptional regulator